MGVLDFLFKAAAVGVIGYAIANDNTRESMIRDAERRGDEWEREARKRGYSSEQISAARERYDEKVAGMREASDRFKDYKNSRRKEY
ncbi:MAG: hypothetical protein Q4F00_05365 [bacterium]|nr:hypothetical protein [bacterium]